MATFHTIPYVYTSTTTNATRSKSAATRRKPALNQVSILEKIQCMKQSGMALSTNQLAVSVAAADNYGGYTSGIQGMFQNRDVWLVATMTDW